MTIAILQYIGLCAFAASGALLGVAHKLDLFGVCVVGAFTGVGGGAQRDVLLGVHPPTAVRSWPSVTIAVSAAVVVFVIHPMMSRLRREMLVLDAMGMGLFASTGTLIGLGHHVSGLGACLIGATTAIGGGIIRDMLLNEVPILLHRDLYAVPALVGSALVVLLHDVITSDATVVIVGTVAATGLRLLALWRGWQLPQPRP